MGTISGAIFGAMVIVLLEQIMPGFALPPFEKVIVVITGAANLAEDAFFGLPPPVSATANPNPPSSRSSMGIILAINNRDDIEVFFKLKFLFVIVKQDTKR